jgi:hypothetical protein
MAEATKETLRATSLMPSLTVNELNESLKRPCSRSTAGTGD